MTYFVAEQEKSCQFGKLNFSKSSKGGKNNKMLNLYNPDIVIESHISSYDICS